MLKKKHNAARRLGVSDSVHLQQRRSRNALSNNAMKPTLLLAALSLLFGPLAHAAPPANLVRAELLADTSTIAPGSTFTLGVKFTIKPQWHIYWANAGETGTPTQITPTGPTGFTFGPILWPLPSKLNTEAGLSYAYENQVLLLIPVTVPKDAPTGEVTLSANVKWLACHDTCIEGKAPLSISLTVAPEAKPANTELFQTWRAKLPIDTEAATELKNAQQADSADGTPKPILNVQLKEAPAKIDWYPLSTRAVMIEDVTVKQTGAIARIEFKPTIFKADQLPPDGTVGGVLVLEDAKGNRRGITLPVWVVKHKPRE